MLNRTLTIATGLVLMAGLLWVAGVAPAQASRGGAKIKLTAEEEAFAAAVGVGAYAYGINETMAYTMGSIVLPLPGHPMAEAFRTSGSAAEHEGADFLKAEMGRIGLVGVQKEPFPVHAYEFRGASVQVVSPTPSEVMLASGYTGVNGTPPGGITAEVVYVGLGRKRDYEGKDVTGKIVLVDVNTEEMWWLNFPHMEARVQGAIGLVVHWVEYQSIEDSVVTHDSEAELSIPAVTVSHKNFASLKELAETSSEPVVVTMVNDADQMLEGTSYNVVGYIPGTTRADEQIIFTAHYDTHWYGATDDGSGVARLLALAKTFVDSGYQPSRTLVFLATGSEEFGWTDTDYDWAIGAYNAIHNEHPDWAGKTVGYFNLEGGGITGATSVFAAGIPSTGSFLWEQLLPLFDKYFSTTAPYNAYYFPSGIGERLESTLTDAFSFASHGIATMVVQSRRPRPLLSPYTESVYHTQMDTMDRISAESLAMSIISNGITAIRLDRAEVPPYDFQWWAKIIERPIEDEVLADAGIDRRAFDKALAKLDTQGIATYGRINSKKGFKDPAAATALMLEAQKLASSTFHTVDGYTFTDLPNGMYMKDALVLNEVINFLEEGDVNPTLVHLTSLYGLEEGHKVSREVYQEMVINRRNNPTRDDLFWATGRAAVHTDLYDEYMSLKVKRDVGDTDYSAELASIRAEYASLSERLQGAIDSMADTMVNVTLLLKQVERMK
jgi:hypothetical protein